MVEPDELRARFKSRFAAEPRLFRAPGRVNIIGEHTDYNEGFVLPAAIEHSTFAAAAPRNDRVIRGASLGYDVDIEFSLDLRDQAPLDNWGRYVQGVALILERSGIEISGADILIESDIPAGAGLSSSAALEVLTGFALSALFGQTIDAIELAKICQKAEHEYGGVKSGLMDQFTSIHGIAGKAMFLDCRTLEYSPVELGSARFVICNTKTKHQLAESQYNARRAECAAAAEIFEKKSLRDVSQEDLDREKAGMPATLFRRARHVITENARVLEAVDALAGKDLTRLGSLISESHQSLRDDFEVSCRELDLMVDAVMRQPGVLGARMIGGGFGGCVIGLFDGSVPSGFPDSVAAEFLNLAGTMPEIYQCNIGRGVEEIR